MVLLKVSAPLEQMSQVSFTLHTSSNGLAVVSLEHYVKKDSVIDDGSEERALGWLSNAYVAGRKGTLCLRLIYQVLFSCLRRRGQYECKGPLHLVEAELGNEWKRS